jgi:hypothetical protein
VTRKNWRRVAASALGVGLGLAALSGCVGDKANEPFRDAPRTHTSNSGPAQVIEMPDGFNNLASKCDGPNRVYVTYHGDSSYGAVFVVKDDPRCAGSTR